MAATSCWTVEMVRAAAGTMTALAVSPVDPAPGLQPAVAPAVTRASNAARERLGMVSVLFADPMSKPQAMRNYMKSGDIVALVHGPRRLASLDGPWSAHQM